MPHCRPAMTPGGRLLRHAPGAGLRLREASGERWGRHGERGVHRRGGGRGWGRGGEAEKRRRWGSEENCGGQSAVSTEVTAARETATR